METFISASVVPIVRLLTFGVMRHRVLTLCESNAGATYNFMGYHHVKVEAPAAVYPDSDSF